MTDKDGGIVGFAIEQIRDWLPYISTLLLSSWGGFVSYIQRIRIKRHKFSWRELSFDLLISSFAGLLTHFFCEYSSVSGSMSAILIAVSGHMGTRAIAGFEVLRDRIFGLGEQNDKQP